MWIFNLSRQHYNDTIIKNLMCLDEMSVHYDIIVNAFLEGLSYIFLIYAYCV